MILVLDLRLSEATDDIILCTLLFNSSEDHLCPVELDHLSRPIFAKHHHSCEIRNEHCLLHVMSNDHNVAFPNPFLLPFLFIKRIRLIRIVMVNLSLREFLEHSFILLRVDLPGYQEIGRGERRGKDE